MEGWMRLAGCKAGVLGVLLGGWKMNRRKMNGWKMNRRKMNGWKMNGWKMNGWKLGGWMDGLRALLYGPVGRDQGHEPASRSRNELTPVRASLAREPAASEWRT